MDIKEYKVTRHTQYATEENTIYLPDGMQMYKTTEGYTIDDGTEVATYIGVFPWSAELEKWTHNMHWSIGNEGDPDENFEQDDYEGVNGFSLNVVSLADKYFVYTLKSVAVGPDFPVTDKLPVIEPIYVKSLKKSEEEELAATAIARILTENGSDTSIETVDDKLYKPWRYIKMKEFLPNGKISSVVVTVDSWLPLGKERFNIIALESFSPDDISTDYDMHEKRTTITKEEYDKWFEDVLSNLK